MTNELNSKDIIMPEELLLPSIDPDTNLNRLNSSDKYIELLKEYEKLHDTGPKMFNGRSLVKFVPIIKGYIQKHKCKTLLDYGCGKGTLYTNDFKDVSKEMTQSLPDYWGLESFQLYDPAYSKHSTQPAQRKDIVICTDVLEHIPEEDLGWVVDEIYSYAKKVVFLNVACFKALKHFKDGTNVHVSLFDPEQWLDFLAWKSEQFRHLSIYVYADTVHPDYFDKERKKVETNGYKIQSRPKIISLPKPEQIESM